MEVIICTPCRAMPEKSGVLLKEIHKENSKKKKNKFKKYFAPSIKNLQVSSFTLAFLGLILGLHARGGLILSMPKAQAATISQSNLDLAKTFTNNISEIVNNGQPQNSVETSFTPDGFLAKPLVIQTEVTLPEKIALKINPRKIAPIKTVKNIDKKADIDIATGGYSFPYGYCTYYVAQKRTILWRGNAITWLSGARAAGFVTGNIPQVGAIMVTSEGGRTGHVAYVDAVSGDQITVSEMNYSGFGKITSRTISSSYGAIMGYIY